MAWFEAAAKSNDVYRRLQAEDLEDVAAALAVFGDYSVGVEDATGDRGEATPGGHGCRLAVGWHTERNCALGEGVGGLAPRVDEFVEVLV